MSIMARRRQAAVKKKEAALKAEGKKSPEAVASQVKKASKKSEK